MTRIHLVTPALNSEKTIARTIHSVLGQHGDFELFYTVMDGGSKDSTLRICERYSSLIHSKSLEIFCTSLSFEIISEPDLGMYDAIWKGFQRRQGDSADWLGWINSDDILNPDALSTLAAIDREHRSINWVGGEPSIVNGTNGLKIGYASRFPNRYAISKGLCEAHHWNFLQQEGTFFRRLLWDSVDNEKEFRKFRYAGDWSLWRNLAKIAEFYQVPWAMGSFFVYPEQISTAKRYLYDAEINMTVPFEERSRRLSEMKVEDTTKMAINTIRTTGNMIITPERNGTLMGVWKNKSENRMRVIQSEQNAASEESKLHLASPGDHFVHSEEYWQYPAITEKHAAQKLASLLAPSNDRAYLAFPWATLFDLTAGNKERSHVLTSLLGEMRRKIQGKKKVFTVCQHINMLKYHEIMTMAGVTDVFWSHCVKGQDGVGGINIHPFPLFPVHIRKTDKEPNYLFSFVGSAETSPIRKKIMELFGKERDSLVIDRGLWHYRGVVYRNQIGNGHIPECDSDQMRRKEAEYLEIMNCSLFSLCPRGTGPNTIRLWEAVECGSIPVIISDDQRLPGHPSLWRDAVVFVSESSIESIPTILRELAGDKTRMERMRRSLDCIRLQYGRDSFVTDIVKQWGGASSYFTDSADQLKK